MHSANRNKARKFELDRVCYRLNIAEHPARGIALSAGCQVSGVRCQRCTEEKMSAGHLISPHLAYAIAYKSTTISQSNGATLQQQQKTAAAPAVLSLFSKPGRATRQKLFWGAAPTGGAYRRVSNWPGFRWESSQHQTPRQKNIEHRRRVHSSCSLALPHLFPEDFFSPLSGLPLNNKNKGNA